MQFGRLPVHRALPHQCLVGWSSLRHFNRCTPVVPLHKSTPCKPTWYDGPVVHVGMVVVVEREGWPLLAYPVARRISSFDSEKSIDSRIPRFCPAKQTEGTCSLGGRESRIAARAYRWSIPLVPKAWATPKYRDSKVRDGNRLRCFSPLYICLDCSLIFLFFIATAERSSILASAWATAPIVGTVKCRARRTVTVSGLRAVTIGIIVWCQKL